MFIDGVLVLTDTNGLGIPRDIPAPISIGYLAEATTKTDE